MVYARTVLTAVIAGAASSALAIPLHFSPPMARSIEIKPTRLAAFGASYNYPDYPGQSSSGSGSPREKSTVPRDITPHHGPDPLPAGLNVALHSTEFGIIVEEADKEPHSRPHLHSEDKFALEVEQQIPHPHHYHHYPYQHQHHGESVDFEFEIKKHHPHSGEEFKVDFEVEEHQRYSYPGHHTHHREHDHRHHVKFLPVPNPKFEKDDDTLVIGTEGSRVGDRSIAMERRGPIQDGRFSHGTAQHSQMTPEQKDARQAQKIASSSWGQISRNHNWKADFKSCSGNFEEIWLTVTGMAVAHVIDKGLSSSFVDLNELAENPTEKAKYLEKKDRDLKSKNKVLYDIVLNAFNNLSSAPSSKYGPTGSTITARFSAVADEANSNHPSTLDRRQSVGAHTGDGTLPSGDSTSKISSPSFPTTPTGVSSPPVGRSSMTGPDSGTGTSAPMGTSEVVALSTLSSHSA